jgi:ribosomal protein S18 acetylase RimI-like enzyme
VGAVPDAPSSHAVSIHHVEAVDAELVDAFARLVPQLSATSPAPPPAWLERIVGSPDVALYVARDSAVETKGGGAIVGSLTLAFYPMPTRLKAWIEDVVVDEAARGKKVGELLTLAAIEEAKRRGAKSVDLTSRPSRQSAHRLYEKTGFEIRDTAVYRLNLHGDPSA